MKFFQSPKMLRAAIVGGALLAAFTLGFAFHAIKFFPYHQIKGVVSAVLSAGGGADVAKGGVDPGDIINRQYILDRTLLSLDKQVDSVLLPLKIEGMRVSETNAFAKGAGAITSVGNSVIVMDRLGNFYGSRAGGSVEKLAFPPLPNNIEAYIASAKSPGLNNENFRAHRVLFSSSLRSLVVSHSYFDTALAQARIGVSLVGIDEDSLKPTGAWQTIFLSEPLLYGPHEGSGGAMLLLDGARLELAINNQAASATDKNLTWGAIVEVDLKTRTSKVVSVGHRGVSGMAALSDGRFVSVDMGPRGGDEVNLIREGGNYGYPHASLGSGYDGYRSGTVEPMGSHAGYTQPIFAWLPSVAVSDVLPMKRFHKSWDGDLLVSSLKGMSLYRLRLVDGHVQYSEQLFIGQRVRDIAELEDGTIAMWTDDAQLLFLSVDHEKLSSGRRFPGKDNEAMIEHCLTCHHFGPTSPAAFAPTLSGLFERRIASDNFRYSAGLRDHDASWTESSLRAYLSDPGKFAPGTSMPNRNLRPDELDDIMEVLKAE